MNTTKLFPLGRTVITPAALEILTQEDMQNALQRHQQHDWGDLCKSDKRENDAALKEGFRLLSAYKSARGTTFWIISEADRSATTILLPSDY